MKSFATLLLAIAFCTSVPALAQKSLTKPMRSPQQQSSQTVKAAVTPTMDERLQSSGSINGHGFVDLGLSVRWATCNIGATDANECGDYYAWGETQTKTAFTPDNNLTSNQSFGDIKGNPRHDAACALWGETWRLPSQKEMEELIENTTVEWTTYKGMNGCLLTSRKNGKSIFFPAAGNYGHVGIAVGDYGYYLTSTPNGENSNYQFHIDCKKKNLSVDAAFRNIGKSIRPVTK